LVDQKPLRSILLMDDDPLILELGRELLEHLGFRVATASDAPQAMAVFRGLERVDPAIQAPLKQCGVQGIIYKPFRLTELQQSIRVALAAGRGH
jgi:CheY-like chemotaxis protein